MIGETVPDRCLPSLCVASLLLSTGLALADPELVEVHHCEPTDPDAGDYRLQGGLIELLAETDANRPTPGAADASLWIEGLGWINRADAALLVGEDLANRVQIVFVGDGYTAPELVLYEQQVAAFAIDMFADEPLATYRTLFAVHRVDIVSTDSGVSNDPVAGITRDTELGMAYWCGNLERRLCVDVGAAWAYASTAMLPAGASPDQVIALANSSKYGGAGYSSNNLGTASAGHSAAVELVLHELGHSMGDLADEYTYGGPTVFSGFEPSPANASKLTSAQMASQNTKWADWLGTDLASWDGLHSTYEGAVYSEQGVYRPTNDSKMRSLYRPFNLVAAEAFIKEIYKQVKPIDAIGPTQNVTEHTELFVVPVRPVGQPLEIQWSFDGQPVPGATGETFDTRAFGLSGFGLLSVRVRDTTPWVRDEAFRDASMTQTYLFLINLPASCPGDIADDFGTLPPLGGADGMVSFGDFLALLGLVGPCPGMTPGCTGDIADDFGTLNGGDGMVSFGDFLALLGLVGPCP